MIEKLPDLVNGEDWLVRRGRFVDDVLMIEVGDDQYLVTIRAGRIEKIEKGPHVMRAWTFAIRASAEVWARFWKPAPAPGDHDIFALLRKGEIAFDGDLQPFMANLLYYKLVLAAPRRLEAVA